MAGGSHGDRHQPGAGPRHVAQVAGHPGRHRPGRAAGARGAPGAALGPAAAGRGRRAARDIRRGRSDVRVPCWPVYAPPSRASGSRSTSRSCVPTCSPTPPSPRPSTSSSHTPTGTSWSWATRSRCAAWSATSSTTRSVTRRQGPGTCVQVHVRRDGDDVELTVRDAGRVWPTTPRPRRSTGSGALTPHAPPPAQASGWPSSATACAGAVLGRTRGGPAHAGAQLRWARATNRQTPSVRKSGAPATGRAQGRVLRSTRPTMVAAVSASGGTAWTMVTSPRSSSATSAGSGAGRPSAARSAAMSV